MKTCVYALRSTGIVVEGPVRGGGVGSEQGLEEGQGMDALPVGGLYEARDDAVGFEALFRSGSEADFAEDDKLAQ